MTQITLNRGGTAERTVDVDSLQVPDVWNASFVVDEHLSEAAGERIRECWNLCHNLLRHAQEQAK